MKEAAWEVKAVWIETVMPRDAFCTAFTAEQMGQNSCVASVHQETQAPIHQCYLLSSHHTCAHSRIFLHHQSRGSEKGKRKSLSRKPLQ